jgi:polyhydroxyalkanoate synthase
MGAMAEAIRWVEIPSPKGGEPKERADRPAATPVATAEAEPLKRSTASLLRVLRPGSMLRQTARFGQEMARIAVGSSEITPDPKDKRFADPAWSGNLVYRRLLQTYLAWVDAVHGAVSEDPEVWRDFEEIHHALELLTSAAAPTNTFWGNPAAIKEAFDTGGSSILRGAKNMLSDLWNNQGMPSQVDRSAFEVGKDVALTPGAVVFRNEVLEIIQYATTTENVLSTPTLMIPPQINKYYFMDLAPGRSFVEYALSQGHPILTVSWRNPTRAQRDWDLDTYVGALLEAITAVCEVTGSEKVNLVSFCAGGITATALLAYMARIGDDRVASIAYGVTMLDWYERAPLGRLQRPGAIALSRAVTNLLGVFPGEQLSGVFSWARPDDLVWRYWVNNYLMGRKPPGFDILAWNNDSTNLPAALHEQFVQVFFENAMCSGRLEVMGEPVDLASIEVDNFVTGAVTDHLTPWKGCYRTTQLLGGDSTFVLSNAGHIASLVNPPGNPKASYRLGPKPGPDPEAWLAESKQSRGTWWTVWCEWARERSGPEKKATGRLGSDLHPALEPAPGRYVRQGV